jgi:glutamate formiminotransferase
MSGSLECVVNISEGRRPGIIQAIASEARDSLLDVHSDGDHNRTVLTLAGVAAPRAVAAATVARLDLGAHDGVHPRIGVVDVVPFVPLAGAELADAVHARDEFAVWIGEELGVPAFRYGPERSLPEVRRGAFTTLAPDAGPAQPHPSAGGVAVGARPLLVAWNVYLEEADLALAKRIASAVRGPRLRALGLQVGPRVQVSMNLIAPAVVGPAEAWDLVAAHAPVAEAELVGLVPESVLHRTPEDRWPQLDLAEDKTIESRLREAGLEQD